VFSTTTKIIGIQYLITAMAMAIVGGLLSMLIALPARLAHSLSR